MLTFSHIKRLSADKLKTRYFAAVKYPARFLWLGLTLLLLLLCAAVPLLAQHQHGGADCNASLIGRSLKTISELAKAAEELVEAENLDDALLMLDNIQHQVVRVKANCFGLVFRSENEGLQAVVGPVPFPDGIYRARLTTNGRARVEFTAVDGNCDDNKLLFDLAAGYAIVPNGAEAVFSPRECSGLIAVSADEPWLLVFEAVSGGGHQHDE